MKKVFIFGCGDVGEQNKKKYEEQNYNILGFIDNDINKHGLFKNNIEIYSPDVLINTEFDLIAIAIFKGCEIVYEQLVSLGIQEDKIEIPIKPTKLFYNNTLDLNTYINNDNIENYISENIKYNTIFMNRINMLIERMNYFNIPLNEVCIVSGAVEEILGIRETKTRDDIDIIMTDRFRELYGKDLIIVSDEIEVHKQNMYFINDNEIIQNSNYHFYFMSIKVIKLEYMKCKEKK